MLLQVVGALINELLLLKVVIEKPLQSYTKDAQVRSMVLDYLKQRIAVFEPQVIVENAEMLCCEMSKSGTNLCCSFFLVAAWCNKPEGVFLKLRIGLPRELVGLCH